MPWEASSTVKYYYGDEFVISAESCGKNWAPFARSVRKHFVKRDFASRHFVLFN